MSRVLGRSAPRRRNTRSEAEGHGWLVAVLAKKSVWESDLSCVTVWKRPDLDRMDNMDAVDGRGDAESGMIEPVGGMPTGATRMVAPFKTLAFILFYFLLLTNPTLRDEERQLFSIAGVIVN